MCSYCCLFSVEGRDHTRKRIAQTCHCRMMCATYRLSGMNLSSQGSSMPVPRQTRHCRDQRMSVLLSPLSLVTAWKEIFSPQRGSFALVQVRNTFFAHEVLQQVTARSKKGLTLKMTDLQTSLTMCMMDLARLAMMMLDVLEIVQLCSMPWGQRERKLD